MTFCRPMPTFFPFRGVCLGMRGSSPGRMTSGVGREAPRHWEQSFNGVNNNKNMNELKKKQREHTEARGYCQDETILKIMSRSSTFVTDPRRDPVVTRCL